MQKKSIQKIAPRSGKQDIRSVSTADLYAMLLFVSADANKTFGDNEHAKLIVRGKQKEIEDELYFRIYGFNPYTGEARKVKPRKRKVMPSPERSDILVPEKG